MRDLFYLEVRKKLEEISDLDEMTRENGTKSLLTTIDIIFEMVAKARKRGWLALEEDEMNFQNYGTEYSRKISKMIGYFIGGENWEVLENLYMAMYTSSFYKDYEALRFLLMIQGMYFIYHKMYPSIIEDTILYLLPQEAVEEYRVRQMEDVELQKKALEENREHIDTSAIDRICLAENFPVILQDSEFYDRVISFEKLFTGIDDRGIQYILCKVDDMTLAASINVLSVETRKIIFKNLSEKRAVEIAQKVENIGSIHIADSVQACENMYSIIRELIDNNVLITTS